VATYTTDLTVFKDFEAATTMGEMVGYTQGGTPALDTDYPIQGTQHASAATTKTGLSSIMADFGSNPTWTSGHYIFMWAVFLPAGAVDTFANGGLRFLVGSDITANWDGWKIGGKDFGRYPLGGWMNFVVDPELTADYGAGTPTGYRWVGIGVNLVSAISKGVPLGLDCIRYGRGELRVAGTAATFADMVATSDSTSNRWGLFQAEAGSYRWKGLMVLGYAASTSFTDSNVNIVIDDNAVVNADFNTIEVRNASTVVNWTGVNITALGTVSKGQFEMIDAADVDFTSCVFTDMDSFLFLSTGASVSCTWRRCGLVTAGGATFSKCVFDKPTGTIGVTASSPANAALITDSTFVSDGTGHGLEITGTAANMTLTNCTWTGYAGSDGSTGNEAIYVNIASGSMNLTISGGTTPSVRTAGATVTVISGAVTVTATVTDGTSAIQNARVFLQAAAGGPFPSDVTVTISNSGTTATVTHTAHGMATNDKVVIRGASLDANNGIFTITKINNDSYSYTMGSTPGSSPTGTIKATFVIIHDLTSAGGTVQMSRVFSSSQPFTGWARKSTSAPYFKQGAMTGTVSSTTGATPSVVLVSDD
jgi:hypothetical protein